MTTDQLVALSISVTMSVAAVFSAGMSIYYGRKAREASRRMVRWAEIRAFLSTGSLTSLAQRDDLVDELATDPKFADLVAHLRRLQLRHVRPARPANVTRYL